MRTKDRVEGNLGCCNGVEVKEWSKSVYMRVCLWN